MVCIVPNAHQDLLAFYKKRIPRVLYPLLVWGVVYAVLPYTLGMTEWRIFWRIHLPNALPGIIAGGLLAFARGLGEFGATAMIAGNIAGRTRTLPLAVYSAVAAGDWDAAGWYVAVIVGICLLVVIGLNVYLYKTKQQQGE